MANDHVDGLLTRRQRLGVRLHLMMCKHCRRAIRQLRATLALVRSLGSEVASPPEPAYEGTLVEMFRKERGRGDPQ